MPCSPVFTAPQSVRSPLTRAKLHETYFCMFHMSKPKCFRDHSQQIILDKAENYTKYYIYHMLWRYLRSSYGTKEFRKIGKKIALGKKKVKTGKSCSTNSMTQIKNKVLQSSKCTQNLTKLINFLGNCLSTIWDKKNHNLHLGEYLLSVLVSGGLFYICMNFKCTKRKKYVCKVLFIN